MLDAHIIAIKFEDGDGLWHGALYINNPTPSGCDRYLLSKSDPIGNEDPNLAMKRISEIFPDIQTAYIPTQPTKEQP